MIFSETKLQGAYIVELEELRDSRGFFARGWCAREFAERDLMSTVVQTNISYNTRRGTLRGMHYQIDPYAEMKLVHCTRGALYDVIVDLRPNSPTYRNWIGVELSAANRRMVFVPKGFAHGFQTLEDDTEVFYQISDFYEPAAARGALYNDPAFKIEWPLAVAVISEKDASWPRYSA